MKLLVLGFSLTAVQDGYTQPFRERLARSNPELAVDFCGLGGLNPTFVPIALANILGKDTYTHVLLEISTSIYGRITTDTDEDIEDLVFDILTLIADHGASVAFAKFFRMGHDYKSQKFDTILDRIAQTYAIPLVNLADGLVDERGIDFAVSTLRDDVHTNASGSEFQADALMAELGVWFASGRPVSVPRPTYLRQIFLPQQDDEFAKQNYAFACLKIAEGERLSVEMSETLITGMAYIMGPDSGDFRVGLNGTHDYALTAFDERCYYERIGMRRLGPRFATSLTVDQKADLPTVPLLKGEAYLGPRNLRLLGFTIRRPATSRLPISFSSTRLASPFVRDVSGS